MGTGIKNRSGGIKNAYDARKRHDAGDQEQSCWLAAQSMAAKEPKAEHRRHKESTEPGRKVVGKDVLIHCHRTYEDAENS